MPGITQPSLLSSDHPPTIKIELRVAASGKYVWGRVELEEHSGRRRRVLVPHTLFTGNFLTLADDMRDVFTAWLYHDTTEVVRVLKRSIERWQDDCEEEGGHPAHNR